MYGHNPEIIQCLNKCFFVGVHAFTHTNSNIFSDRDTKLSKSRGTSLINVRFCHRNVRFYRENGNKIF